MVFCLCSGGAKPSSVGLTEPRAVLNAFGVEGGKATSGYPSPEDTWQTARSMGPRELSPAS